MIMNKDNIIDFMENNSNVNNSFDFNNNWNSEYINMDDDDEIIIGKNDIESDAEFDNSFEDDDKILSILNDKPLEETTKEEQSSFTNESTELDKFFDNITVITRSYLTWKNRVYISISHGDAHKNTLIKIKFKFSFFWFSACSTNQKIYKHIWILSPIGNILPH